MSWTALLATLGLLLLGRLQAAVLQSRSNVVLEEQCGRQSIAPVFREGRIINGDAAVFHSWPWQASLYGVFAARTELVYWYQCGGAIINDQWILTAAHCFFYPPEVLALREWRIHTGERHKDESGPSVQVRLVDNYILHDKFVFANKSNDIALVKLASKLSFNEHVHPICLPTVDKDKEEKQFCVVVGFRHDKNEMIPRRAAFHQLRTPIIPTERCASEEFYGLTITDDMICSGHAGGRNDTCQGDSGRPLMCLNGDRWAITGVLSFGHNKCGQPKKPGVYTKISSYLPWILNTIRSDSQLQR